jgi:hypothetical protein
MMVGRSTRRKKNVWGVRPGARDMRKEWINAFVKRLNLIDLASGGLRNKSASERIVEAVQTYRKLVPDLRDSAVWPDDKLPFIVKTSIKSLELSVAVIQFGLDSDQYHRASARLDELMKEEMDKDIEREFQEELATSG